MVGRASYNNVMEMSNIDSIIFGDEHIIVDRKEIMLKYADHLDQID